MYLSVPLARDGVMESPLLKPWKGGLIDYKGPPCSRAHLHTFVIILLESFVARFFIDFGTILESKTHPKSSKKMISIFT